MIPIGTCFGGSDLVYEGAHVPATAHQDGDIVIKDGQAYIAVRPTNAAPDPSEWGAIGTVGAPGPTGPQGPQGPQGPAGAAGVAPLVIAFPAVPSMARNAFLPILLQPQPGCGTCAIWPVLHFHVHGFVLEARLRIRSRVAIKRLRQQELGRL